MKSNPVYMDGDEYQRALEAIGLSVRAASRFLAIDESTSFRYRTGVLPVPKPIAMLLSVMVEGNLTAADVDLEGGR